MTYMVAYDDSALSRAALDRAVEFASVRGERVYAVTAVPQSASYARAKGWLAEGADFDPDRVEAALADRVARRHPDVTFHPLRMEATPPAASIGLAVRRAARDHDADIVFVGSTSAGRIVTNLVSVGQNVVTDTGYDVHVVRRLPG